MILCWASKHAIDTWETGGSLILDPCRGEELSADMLRESSFNLLQAELQHVATQSSHEPIVSHSQFLRLTINLQQFWKNGLPEVFTIQKMQSMSSVWSVPVEASRMRISKTEFISCPSCGRTLFNLLGATDGLQKLGVLAIFFG